MRLPEELLYDSEASLRLVDHVIEELGTDRCRTNRDEAVDGAAELAERLNDLCGVGTSSVAHKRRTA